ncbi:hypothetical protein V6N12_035596 [Hibiscus sabdariffa]|uniref:Protein TAR1 n=1 Tax=Hibiscus sabdariffa TaxID=183260 RepID=A0ABR2ENL1_9ROSI
MCKCRSHGTFPLFGLQSSHLNICYYHQDLHRRPLRPGSRPGFYGDRRALLLIGAWPLPRRPGIGHALKRHPFSGLVDSAVSLRASTRVSSGFAPLRHSSPSFGSRQACSHSNPSQKIKTPWSVFQDGPDGEPAGRRPEHAGAEARRDGACWVPRSRRRRLHGRIEGPGLGRHHDPRRSTPRADRRTGSRRSTSDRGASPAPIRFPPDNFKHSLTLFPKSFSSFPRGTCSLSVSRPYLALDGIYRPIRAAFPNNPTRRQRLVVRQGPGTTGLSPSPVPLSRGLGPGPPLRTLLQTTIRTPRATDSQAGLFPVRSPLLRESFTVLAVPKGSESTDRRKHTTRNKAARSNTTDRRGTVVAEDSILGQPRATCPRPNGLGRNLRSKTRWFTGFCNSHQVSHFATFFIDARAEISVAESRFVYSRQSGHVSAARAPRTGVQQQTATFSFRFLGVIHAGGCSFCHGDTGSRVTGTGRGRGAMKRPHPLPLMFDNTFTGRSARQVSTMILPQVHLRKPCYDFSFL